MYLYTDEIDFAPFGSRVNRELRIPELVSEEADTIPRPSPKSVYRIADMVRVNNHGGDYKLIAPVRQYDLPKLKDLAFESIRGGVKSCDAVEETFSKFASRLVCATSLRTVGLSTVKTRYPEIVDLHVKNLASVLLSSESQEIQGQLDKKLRSFASGEIPHAADAFSALFGILARHRASDVTPKDIDNANIQTDSKCTWVVGGNLKAPPHRKSMNIALIKSIRHGSFLDMEYRVRKKQVGANQFTPIYLSSCIFHDIRSKFGARKLRPTPIRPALINPLQWYMATTTILGREGTKWIVTAIAKRISLLVPRRDELMIRCKRVTFRTIISCLAPSRREFE